MKRFNKLFSCLLACSISAKAFAHHPTGGKVPSNVLEGLLSGLAHPIIGLDHLAFIVGSAILAGILCKPNLIFSFVCASILGTIFHVNLIDIPYAEVSIAASVMFLALVLLRPNVLSYLSVNSFLFVAGILHGYAYGESIVGAEMHSLYGYLAGFILVQTCLAGAISYFVSEASQAMKTKSRYVVASACAVTGLAMIWLG